MLFLRHHDGERYDVLCLLHRGHVNHASAEGECTLNRFTTEAKAEREILDQTYTVNVLQTFSDEGYSRLLYEKHNTPIYV